MMKKSTPLAAVIVLLLDFVACIFLELSHAFKCWPMRLSQT